MEDASPAWTRWLGLTLAFQALVMFEVSRPWAAALRDDALGLSRPVLWWVVTVTLAVGVVRVTSRPSRAPRWWGVAVVVGPLVWVVASVFGDRTTVTGPLVSTTVSEFGPALQVPGSFRTTTTWAYLREPQTLLLPSLVALGLRWPDGARWVARRWHPAAPRVVAGGAAAAVVAWLAMPDAVYDLVPLVVVAVLVPAVVAAGRGVSRAWARWVGLATALGHVSSLIVLDALRVEGGLSPFVDVDLPAHPTAEGAALGLVGWGVATITVRGRERRRGNATTAGP